MSRKNVRNRTAAPAVIEPPPASPPAPSVVVPYCDGFRYQFDQFGVISMHFCKDGQWVSAAALPLALAQDFQEKLRLTIAQVTGIRPVDTPS